MGLVVNRTRVIDPHSGNTLVRTRWGVLAAAADKLVLSGPNRTFLVHDATTSVQRRLRWPSIIRRLDEPAVDPRGRFIALAFADPAWRGRTRNSQALDVWLLDLKTMRLTQVPGMPALVSLKFTNMTWTSDGRLVLLGRTGGRDVVAVLRPGDEQFAIKTLRLPARGDSGSDTFAILG